MLTFNRSQDGILLSTKFVSDEKIGSGCAEVFRFRVVPEPDEHAQEHAPAHTHWNARTICTRTHAQSLATENGWLEVSKVRVAVCENEKEWVGWERDRERMREERGDREGGGRETLLAHLAPLFTLTWYSADPSFPPPKIPNSVSKTKTRWSWRRKAYFNLSSSNLAGKMINLTQTRQKLTAPGVLSCLMR